MGIRIINIRNPLINKYNNNTINENLFDEVILYINKIIREIKDDCSDYNEVCSSNNGSDLINNLPHYLLEISFKYVNMPILIEYHFCYNNDITKIINNIYITINYQYDDIKEYGIILEKFKKLKETLLSENKNLNKQLMN